LKINNKIENKDDKYTEILKKLSALYDYQNSLKEEGLKVNHVWERIIYKLKIDLIATKEDKNNE
jgi:hypothetical protein